MVARLQGLNQIYEEDSQLKWSELNDNYVIGKFAAKNILIHIERYYFS